LGALTDLHLCLNGYSPLTLCREDERFGTLVGVNDKKQQAVTFRVFFFFGAYHDYFELFLSFKLECLNEAEHPDELSALLIRDPTQRCELLRTAYLDVSEISFVKAKAAFALGIYHLHDQSDAATAEQLLLECIYILDSLATDPQSRGAHKSPVVSELGYAALVNFSEALLVVGKYRFAIRAYEAALANYGLRKKVANPSQTSAFALVAQRQGDLGRAIRLYLTAMLAYKENGKRNETIHTALVLAGLCMERGDHLLAEAVLLSALTMVSGNNATGDADGSAGLLQPASPKDPTMPSITRSSIASTHAAGMQASRLRIALAEIFLAAGSFAKACVVLEQAAAEGSGAFLSRSCLLLAEAYGKRGWACEALHVLASFKSLKNSRVLDQGSLQDAMVDRYGPIAVLRLRLATMVGPVPAADRVRSSLSTLSNSANIACYGVLELPQDVSRPQLHLLLARVLDRSGCSYEAFIESEQAMLESNEDNLSVLGTLYKFRGGMYRRLRSSGFRAVPILAGLHHIVSNSNTSSSSGVSLPGTPQISPAVAPFSPSLPEALESDMGITTSQSLPNRIYMGNATGRGLGKDPSSPAQSTPMGSMRGVPTGGFFARFAKSTSNASLSSTSRRSSSISLSSTYVSFEPQRGGVDLARKCLANYDKAATYFASAGDATREARCRARYAEGFLDRAFPAVCLFQTALEEVIELSLSAASVSAFGAAAASSAHGASGGGGLPMLENSTGLAKVEEAATTAASFAVRTLHLHLCLSSYANLSELAYLKGQRERSQNFWLAARDLIFDHFMDGVTPVLATVLCPGDIKRAGSVVKRLTRLAACYGADFCREHIYIFDAHVSFQLAVRESILNQAETPLNVTTPKEVRFFFFPFFFGFSSLAFPDSIRFAHMALT
jgi:tetratricopeptide (TPR) repeat protein